MKICLINHSIFFQQGGSDISVRKIAEVLKKNKNEVFVITSYNPDLKNSFFNCLKFLKPKTVEMEGIKVYIFYPFLSHISFKGVNIGRFFTIIFGLIWNPWTYIIVKKILKNEKPDIVHTNCNLYISFAPLSAAKSLNIPVVHTINDFGALSPAIDFLSLPII